MADDKIEWKDFGDYRNLRGEAGDYLFLISGGNKYEFHWAAFHKNIEIASSRIPSRNVPEAQRIAEAIYILAKNIL